MLKFEVRGPPAPKFEWAAARSQSRVLDLDSSLRVTSVESQTLSLQCQTQLRPERPSDLPPPPAGEH
ncbi:hypothetical protein PGT21_007219 [Puccinia graminis f. sp. tritici]|uniref:Uncharacterized protein n=1 Tax=Puccinia graminis f. sp. tritici TaxID=56615 RepID=A0A5B0QWZ4_PUCGR|nr:hypothetical protein PGT21_007219 [Puccinia graminis f. sp. tritici]KAA1120495.1 hypothetical protein PGTUg99_006256 [Puccinia graminis f. sp. tritici]